MERTLGNCKMHSQENQIVSHNEPLHQQESVTMTVAAHKLTQIKDAMVTMLSIN